MSDRAPPDYDAVIQTCLAARDSLYKDLGLKDTRRNRLIFAFCSDLVAFAYENNPDKVLVLRLIMAEKVENRDFYAHVTD